MKVLASEQRCLRQSMLDSLSLSSELLPCLSPCVRMWAVKTQQYRRRKLRVSPDLRETTHVFVVFQRGFCHAPQPNLQGVKLEEMARELLAVGGPIANATRADAVRLHDDKVGHNIVLKSVRSVYTLHDE